MFQSWLAKLLKRKTIATKLNEEPIAVSESGNSGTEELLAIPDPPLDQHMMRGALSSDHLILTYGDRGVAGENFANAIVVTGDANQIIDLTVASASALNALFSRIYPPRLHQLSRRSLSRARLTAALASAVRWEILGLLISDLTSRRRP